MKHLIALFALIGVCCAQLGITRGTCNPDLEAMIEKDFDAVRYVGRWYELQRIDNTFQLGGECAAALYSANSDGSIRVENYQLNPDKTRQTEIGRAVVAYPNERPVRGILNVTFPNQLEFHPNYKVLTTDYTSYSLVWSCFQLTSFFKIGKVQSGVVILSVTEVLNSLSDFFYI